MSDDPGTPTEPEPTRPEPPEAAGRGSVVSTAAPAPEDAPRPARHSRGGGDTRGRGDDRDHGHDRGRGRAGVGRGRGRPAPPRPGPAPWRRVAGALVALLLLIAAGVLAARHPLSPALALTGVVGLAALEAWRPGAWLLTLPALLPWLGLAPWSGWLQVEEMDLAIGAMAGAGWLRAALAPVPNGSDRSVAAPGASVATPARVGTGVGRSTGRTVGWGVGAVVGLWTLSVAVSAARGVADAGGWAALVDGGWYQGYREPLQALHGAKPTLLALLLWPLWIRAQARDAEAAARRLQTGLALLLAGVALWCVGERIAFPGLLNTASDYRSTGPFWEMHIGGASLDLSLALAVPMAVALWQAQRRPLAWLAAAAVVLLGAYAALTTFSRIVYAALPLGLAAMAGWQALARRPGGMPGEIRAAQARPNGTGADGAAAWAPGGAAADRPSHGPDPITAPIPAPAAGSAGFARLALAAGVCALAAWAFPTAGYRGLLALLGSVALLLAAAPLLAAEPPRRLLAVALAAALPAAALGLALHLALDKGAYWAFAGWTVLGGAVVLALHRGAAPGSARGTASRGGAARVPAMAVVALLAAWLGQLVCLPLVAAHWGGPAAMPAAATSAALLALGGLAGLCRRPSPWVLPLRQAAGGMLALGLALAVVGVFSGGRYMAGRLGASGDDGALRMAHWRAGLQRLDGLGETLLGAGLGRWADRYALQPPPEARPGDLRLGSGPDGQAALTLVSGEHPMGDGELLRLVQRLHHWPDGPLRLQLSVRAEAPVQLIAQLCRKHLIYADCPAVALQLQPDPARPGWQQLQTELTAPRREALDALLPANPTFSLALGQVRQRVVLRTVALLDAQGRNLLDNGDFGHGLARWFFTSDRNHLPWHAKNLAVQLLFEQGLLGLLAFGAMAALALGCLARPRVRQHPLAPALVGSLLAAGTVGAVDSLLNASRVATWLLLLMLVALTLRAPVQRR